MDRVRLGSSSVSVTRLGLGLAPIAGLYTTVSEAQARATIDRAWEGGIRLFDTAPLYGYGESERRAGLALGRRPRDEFILATKVGRLLVPEGDAGEDIWADLPTQMTPAFDFSVDGIKQSLRESRERLGFDRVDVVHIHDPEGHDKDQLAAVCDVLSGLRDDGEIAAMSVGTNSTDLLPWFAAHWKFDSFMIAGRYTLLDQTALREPLAECTSRGISVLAAGVFNSGILADPHVRPTFNYRPADQELIERALAMERLCASYDVPLRAAAIQFPLAHPAVASVVVGARSPDEVDDAVAALRHPIPEGLWSALKSEGFLPVEAPTP